MPPLKPSIEELADLLQEAFDQVVPRWQHPSIQSMKYADAMLQSVYVADVKPRTIVTRYGETSNKWTISRRLALEYLAEVADGFIGPPLILRDEYRDRANGEKKWYESMWYGSPYDDIWWPDNPLPADEKVPRASRLIIQGRKQMQERIDQSGSQLVQHATSSGTTPAGIILDI